MKLWVFFALLGGLKNKMSVTYTAYKPKKSLAVKDMKAVLEKEVGEMIEEIQVINGELTLLIDRHNLLEICKFLRESELDFNYPRCLCAVDWEDSLEVVYHLSSTTRNHKISLKVRLPREKARVPSLYSVFKGADWHEREAAEMFGIVFEGHPDPRHLLLIDDFDGFPLRKDFPLQGKK